MENIKKITTPIILILTILFSFVIFGYIYFTTPLGEDKVPSAVTSTYVTYVTNPQTGEEVPFMEAQYFSGEYGTGKEMIEVRFNVYSGVNMTAIYSRGFQMIDNEVYYYDTYDSTSFETGNEYQWGEILLTEIDGELFGVALDGTYTAVDPGKVAGNILLGPIWWIADGFYDVESEYNYTIEDFLNVMKNILRSNSNGSGKSTMPLVDLETYIHIYEAGTDNKLSNEQLGERGIQYSYFTVEANYSRNGVLWADQSLFGSIAGDSNYNSTEVDNDKNYWQATSVINLTLNDFTKRDTSDGYYIHLSAVLINKLNQYSDVELVVNIEVDDKLLGFDDFALIGLKNISQINITASTSRNFILRNGCLQNTGVEVKDINTNNIILVDNTGGGK